MSSTEANEVSTPPDIQIARGTSVTHPDGGDKDSDSQAEDIISLLPDELLLSIFQFLGPKDLVTAILQMCL